MKIKTSKGKKTKTKKIGLKNEPKEENQPKNIPMIKEKKVKKVKKKKKSKKKHKNIVKKTKESQEKGEGNQAEPVNEKKIEEKTEAKVEAKVEAKEEKGEEKETLNYDDLIVTDGWKTNKKFTDLDLRPGVSSALTEMGFETMTEIQAKSIPTLLAGRDVLAQAKTGSGKTLAFLVPCIELLRRNKWKLRNGVGCLILTPTRELAIQIYSVASEMMTNMTQTHCLLMGGTSRFYETKKLEKGANLVVATPGRLLDHLINTSFNIKNLMCFVIDEADRIFDVGFSEELKAIIKLIPKDRQTMLFSATQTTQVSDIARVSLKKPIWVDVKQKENSTVETLNQGYIIVEADKKFQLLFTFLKKNTKKKVIVFFSTCLAVKYFAELLNYINIPVLDIHGKLKQKKRTNIFFNFCNAKRGVLLSTNVCARGLDIPDVDWIVQYDPPDNTADYIHRVGRTARAGKKGNALLILLRTEKKYLKYLKEANVPLNEFQFKGAKHTPIGDTITTLIQENYYLYKSAYEAFNSFIKSYTVHPLKDAFNLKTLDVAGVAKSYSLSTVPYVEFRDINVGASSARKKKREQAKRWISGSMKKRKFEE